MAIRFSELMLKIELIYDKPPLPGWQDPRRTIHVHSLYWVHEGRGFFTLDGREFPVGPGSLLYLRPGRELWMMSDTDNPLHMTMILFQAAAVTRHNGAWQVRELAALEMAEVQALRGADREDCEGRIKALRTAWAPGDDGREAAACNLLLRLIRSVSRRQTARGGQERPASGAGPGSSGPPPGRRPSVIWIPTITRISGCLWWRRIAASVCASCGGVFWRSWGQVPRNTWTRFVMSMPCGCWSILMSL